MIKNFRSYDLAVQFYKKCKDFKLPQHLKSQLVRAASSIVLNLAEGSAKPTFKDRRRYYFISLASVRECQSILDISNNFDPDLFVLADTLGAHVYKLCYSNCDTLKRDKKR